MSRHDLGTGYLQSEFEMTAYCQQRDEVDYDHCKLNRNAGNSVEIHGRTQLWLMMSAKLSKWERNR